MNRLCLAGVLTALIALVGCTSSGTAVNPPTRASAHMYLSAGDALEMYNLPLTSTSTPAVTLTEAAAGRLLYVDTQGRLFVPLDGSSSVLAYKLPLKGSSTPAFTLTTSHAGAQDTTEDTSGNVYVSVTSASGYIDIYNNPVDANASPSTTISNNAVGTSGLEYPYGISLAPNGDLYASDTDDVNQFTPPFTAGSVPTASAAPNVNNYGLLTDSSSRVFVANASANGALSVYAQPFTNASTPAFNITVSSAFLFGLAFDDSGNLWAVDDNGVIWEVTAPITSSSTPTQVLTVPNSYGIAFGK